MSSRWISTSFKGRAVSVASDRTAACVALTSDDLPIPRAPHKSTLLAGSPSAKRDVLSCRMSRTRSTPRISPMSIRLGLGTGCRYCVSGSQIKHSAHSKSLILVFSGGQCFNSAGQLPDFLQQGLQQGVLQGLLSYVPACRAVARCRANEKAWHTASFVALPASTTIFRSPKGRFSGLTVR